MTDLFRLVSYDIKNLEDGGKHIWSCFGEQTRWLDFEMDTSVGSICCIYDANDINRIYYVGVCDFRKNAKQRAIRWVDADYLPLLKAEAKSRHVTYNIAWDNVVYKDTTAQIALRAAEKLIQPRKVYSA